MKKVIAVESTLSKLHKNRIIRLYNSKKRLSKRSGKTVFYQIAPTPPAFDVTFFAKPAK